MPSLPAIRAFEAAARLGSFSRAAEELNMTAAAVSYQVKQLEGRLGVMLFRRFPRRVELTEAGELLAPTISGAFATMRAGFTQAAERSQSELSITTLPTVGAAWLVPKLGRFKDGHPDIRSRLDMRVPIADLGGFDFDVAIRSGFGSWPGLESHLLLPNLFTAVCRPDMVAAAHGLAQGRVEAPLLGRLKWWQMWLGALGQGGFSLDGAFGPDLGAEYLYVSAAAAGHGIAMVSPIFFRKEILSGALVMPFDMIVTDGRGYWLAYAAAQARSSKILAFRDWIKCEADADIAEAAPLLTKIVSVV
jgi:LysR family glycine cleavage system transcriptional activator